MIVSSKKYYVSALICCIRQTIFISGQMLPKLQLLTQLGL